MSSLAALLTVVQATARMLREDKNVVVDVIGRDDDPETERRLKSAAAETSRRMRMTERRVSELEESLRGSKTPSPRSSGGPWLLDYLLSPSGAWRHRAAHKNLLRLHKDDARAAQVRIDRNKKDLEIVRRRLALQRDRSEDLERQARERRKVNVYRMRSKFAAPLNYVELVEFPEDKYVDLLARQETTPVLVTIWDAKRLWWYLNRFWWDSEGLDASDVQALILHRELEPSSQDEQV